jgi:hypothetical protein
MTTETSPYPKAPPPPPPAAAATRGWSGSDLLIGGALIVLLIALFLPWFSAAGFGNAGDGPSSHGYLWAVFVLAIVALIVLVARDAIARLPGNLPSPEQMMTGATGLALLLTILGLVQKPSAYPQLGASIGWSYGGFIALLAALVACFAALGIAARLESARRAAEARRHPPGTST